MGLDAQELKSLSSCSIMKAFLPLALLHCALSGLGAHAQDKPAATGFRSQKQILELIPRQQMMQFRTSSLIEKTREAANRILDAQARGKPVTLRVKVLESIPLTDPGDFKFRINAFEQTVNLYGVSIGVRFYAYVSAGQEKAMSRISRGQDVTLSGSLMRVEFTATAEEGVKLNLDMGDTVVEKR